MLRFHGPPLPYSVVWLCPETSKLPSFIFERHKGTNNAVAFCLRLCLLQVSNTGCVQLLFITLPQHAHSPEIPEEKSQRVIAILSVAVVGLSATPPSDAFPSLDYRLMQLVLHCISCMRVNVGVPGSAH